MKKCAVLYFLLGLLGHVPEAAATRVLDRMTMIIDGEEREYFHLYDQAAMDVKQVILFINGSSCTDGGLFFTDLFTEYLSSVNAYMLQMRGINEGDGGAVCSVTFQATDQLAMAVQDNINFIEHQHSLKKLGDHSIVAIGLGDGGNVALSIASKSKKVGWLATFGSGGSPKSENFLAIADLKMVSQSKFYSRDYFEAMFYALLRDPENAKSKFYGFPFTHWKSSLFFDPLPTYASLHIPVFVAMREDDIEVPLRSGRILKEYFMKHPERDFQYREFSASSGSRMGGSTEVSEFINAVSHWLQGRLNAT